jgi:hypothetical protein
MFRLHIE